MISVLIADDHGILRNGMRLLLESEPDIHVVGEAANGLEAVRLADALRPDVILLDIQMPILDGIEACERIRRQVPGSRVLILSHIDTEEYLLRVLDMGARGYVLKQCATEELISAVRGVMEGGVYLTPSMLSHLVARYLSREDEKRHKVRHLTLREEEILKGICTGATNQEIADDLRLSIKTIQSHRANIMDKLGLHNRVELVKYAIRSGLTSPETASVHGG